jgi:hypothetical protein
MDKLMMMYRTEIGMGMKMVVPSAPMKNGEWRYVTLRSGYNWIMLPTADERVEMIVQVCSEF